MYKKNIKRLPVVDGVGKVVGMVYKQNVFNIITMIMLDEKEGMKR